jgi:hypothetical protein
VISIGVAQSHNRPAAKNAIVATAYSLGFGAKRSMYGATQDRTTETAKSSPQSNDEALAAFIARKAEIDGMLDRLRTLSDDHFNLVPDEIHWGHVGTLAGYASLLKRITDAAFREGEHAA